MSNATDEGGPTPGHRAQRSTAEADGSGGANDADRLEERLSAVERALTGSDAAVADLDDGAAAAAEREAMESRLADLESRVDELEAATQAIRGYVGSVRAVNREVERRADLALARASREGEAPGDGARSEDALDAAVPTEEGRRTAAATGDTGAVADGDDADGSWRDEALHRLRESL
jgi:chromosome segregation ATPase